MCTSLHHVDMSILAGGSPTPDPAASALWQDVPEVPPVGTVGVGVIVPYDFALDRELWRWVPESVTLHATRTPWAPLPVSLEQASVVGDPHAVTRCTQDLITVHPDVVAYACTSGSFIGGVGGEAALAAAMVASGAPRAVTTSGALVQALHHLGVSRVAIVTPYNEMISLALSAFLAEAGIVSTGMRHLGLESHIWHVPYAATIDLARRAFTPDCEAVFISCTNLATYDLIAPLEAELGVPVVTANQVTMWAALRSAGVAAVGPGQRLLAGEGWASTTPPETVVDLPVALTQEAG